MDSKHMNNPTEAITSPGATYRSSENVPSVRTLISPPPKFPKLDEVPAASPKPATFDADSTGTVRAENPAVGLDLQTRQITYLPTPTRFNPKTGKHEPVELPLVDDAKPATARPIHDVTKTKTI